MPLKTRMCPDGSGTSRSRRSHSAKSVTIATGGDVFPLFFPFVVFGGSIYLYTRRFLLFEDERDHVQYVLSPLGERIVRQQLLHNRHPTLVCPLPQRLQPCPNLTLSPSVIRTAIVCSTPRQLLLAQPTLLLCLIPLLVPLPKLVPMRIVILTESLPTVFLVPKVVGVSVEGCFHLSYEID